MPHRILILDQDAAFIGALEAYLANTLGYEVVATTDPQAALEAALHDRFNLCILGTSMPGVTGSEIYTRLKNIQPQIEAIFFLPAETPDTESDFLHFALPPERILKKPLIESTNLTRLIISILGPPVR